MRVTMLDKRFRLGRNWDLKLNKTEVDIVQCSAWVKCPEIKGADQGFLLPNG